MHHGEGVDRKLDLPRIASVIKSVKPDFVALQEVDQGTERTNKVDQAVELARLTGLNVLFGGNIRCQGGDYGNAVLSRLPISRHKSHLLPRFDDGEQRGVLQVEIELPEQYGTLLFLATHLDHRPGALHTKAKTAYGYFETKAEPMNSAGSSSFWFKRDATPGWNTEIDVFEIGGKAPGFEHKVNMNVHVFKTPQEDEHWSVGGKWVAPWRLADDYHVYGLEWTPEKIRYFVDGVVVRTAENTHWHQPLSLIFDSETMPNWFGMPEDEDPPSTFSIEYVRAWKKHDDTGWTSLFNGKNLDGWVVKCRPQDQDKAGYWKVVDGTITAETPPGSDHHYIWLLTEKEYDDFELRLKVPTYSGTTGNSGIQVRSHRGVFYGQRSISILGVALLARLH